MGRRENVNVFTVTLFMIGCLSIIMCLSHFRIPNWPSFLLVLSMSIVLSFFPIRLPSGAQVGNNYGTADVGFMFLLLYVSSSACILALLAESVIVSFRAARWNFKSFQWFRVLSTMGMYQLCVYAIDVFLRYSPHVSVWVQSFVVLVIFDGLNLLILLGIQHSIGANVSFKSYLSMAKELAVPLFICSAILATVLQPADPLHLLYRCVYTALILASIIYVTGKHAQSAHLHQNMATKYRAITDNTGDLITAINPDWIVTYASPAHDTLLRRPPSTMEGHSIERFIHPDDLPQLKMALTIAVAENKPFTRQVRFLHEDGREIVTEMKATAIPSEQGEAGNVVLISRDLSERMAAEEMLKKSERLAVIGQLAAGVAHEIRNPLTSVKGFLKLVTRNPEDINRFSPIIWSEFEHIENVINEFLVWSKPQFGQRTERDVVRIMQSVIAVMETQAIMRGVSIQLDAFDPIPDILCDESHLKQVFVNIVKNAIEAMPDGGVIQIAMTESESSVYISVTDEGCGIPKENLDRIGDPFFTTKQDGTGLGMMVTFKIIADHGGTIQLNSDGIRGTTVAIALPKANTTPRVVTV